jgi:hypothetical protein
MDATPPSPLPPTRRARAATSRPKSGTVTEPPPARGRPQPETTRALKTKGLPGRAHVPIHARGPPRGPSRHHTAPRRAEAGDGPQSGLCA